MKKFLILGILACFIAANASADDGHFRKKHQAFSYSSMEMTGGDETLKSNFGFAFTNPEKQFRLRVHLHQNLLPAQGSDSRIHEVRNRRHMD